MLDFGRHLLPLWHLDPHATLLNHGSFGAAPKAVLDAQTELRTEMEHQPDVFFRRKIMPGPDNAIRVVAEQLGAFIGTRGERLALVENATAGINSVLGSFPFKPRDEILFIDQAYNAVRVSIEDTCRNTGAIAKRVLIPIPVSRSETISRIVGAVGPRTRLAIIDHITSPTAVLLPVEDIVRELNAKDVRVLIDGAHAVGQIPLDLDRMGADWYTSNAHKWLYAPKGAAFLFASERAAVTTFPISASHFHGLGFPNAYDYTGTRDNTAWLALPAALDFVAKFGAEKIQTYGRALAAEGKTIMSRFGAEPTAPDDMSVSMRAYMLPQRRTPDLSDVPELMNGLWTNHRIQVNASVFGGRLLIRLSAQIYNDRSDFERLAEALEKDGWPGR
jgi:isopenicillin-N epimerase